MTHFCGHAYYEAKSVYWLANELLEIIFDFRNNENKCAVLKWNYMFYTQRILEKYFSSILLRNGKENLGKIEIFILTWV